METSESFFRSMQGWLALTPQGEGHGSLSVVPMVTEGIASVLVRVPAHSRRPTGPRPLCQLVACVRA